MKKYSILLLVFFLMPFSLFAAESSSLSGSVALKTQYLGSNTQLICDKPVLQADVTYKFTDDLSVNLWGSTDANSSNPSCGKEVDVSLNWKGLTVSRYDIGKIGTNDIDINSIKFSHQYEKFSGWVHYMDPKENDVGFDIKVGYQLSTKWSLAVNAGETPFTQESYVALSGNYDFEWKGISFNLRGSHAPNGADNQKENFVISGTYFW